MGLTDAQTEISGVCLVLDIYTTLTIQYVFNMSRDRRADAHYLITAAVQVSDIQHGGIIH